ncbi:MAG: branched-chain amino acid ABC transporter substrate-binding protein [Alphaproteobacteria bacterium]|nr:MAG: branched-chain amino acid ABC transporter substrate-binding protein [Alphaproteobacteria bacterium]
MKPCLTLGLALGFGLAFANGASAQVKLGVAGPITGGSAAFGAQLKNGVEQAVEDINAQGGILGQKIQVFLGDDRADPKEGVSVANKFVGDGVKFVVGHFNSGVTIPASEVYQENGMLVITPAATNPKVTERNMWNIFRTCGRDDQQGAVAADYILKNFKGKKIAVVHDKTTYGQGLAEETRKNFNAKGLKEVLFEGVNKDKAPFMGADGIADEEFAAIAGPGAEGTLMTFGPDARKRPEAKDIVAKFRAKHFEPQAYTLYSYAAVQIIKQAAEAAKSLDPKKVAAQIKSGMKFTTVIGDLSYDKKGDVTRIDYTVYVWKKDPSGKVTYTEIE